MGRRAYRAGRRIVALCVPSATALAVLCAGPALARPGFRAHPGGAASASAARSEAARTLRFWTPARMRAARPLGLRVGADGRARLRVGAPDAGATASFTPVATPEVAPFSVEGRVFIRRRNLEGYCSATAIDTPTRRLVLTAGHCVNDGREGRRTVWSRFMEFVPAYNGGVAPFGAFVARRDAIFAPSQWTLHGNPDFDMGAMVTGPNSEGVEVADAVGGGATIVTDLPRQQAFQTFGYPGETSQMQGCRSPYIGDDLLSYPLPGPPTMGIRCHWAPGASGGGWLIGDGSQIDGINTYLHLDEKSHTFGPYFSAATVGRLVRGL